jgi:hypothetical protein
VIPPLLDEAVAEGRLQTIIRLREAVERCLGEEAGPQASTKLLSEVRSDEYGITTWVTRFEGVAAEPFAALKATRTCLWRSVCRVDARVEHALA